MWTKISDIANSIQYGYTGSAISIGKYKMLRITDIQNNSVDWKIVPFVEIDDKKAENYLLSDNDIVFARTGATVGKSFLIKHLNEKSVFASYLIRIQLKEKLDVQYVKYFFESGYYWEQIEDKSVGTGQPNVNGTLLSELQIPLPPLPEQHRIVSIIESAFALIDEIENDKQSLEQFIKQAKSKVLDLAIRGKLVPQDPNDEPASVLLERIGNEQKTKKISGDNLHYNQPFEIPESWAWVKMKNIANSIQYGYTGSAIPNGKYKMLRITDIQDNSVDWKTVPFVEIDDKKAKNYLLSDNDIVFARTGATVGKSFLIKDLINKSVFASYLIRIQLKEKLNVQYVKYFFESGYYWEQIEDKSVGTGQPNVNGTLLSELQIPLPSLPEQYRIVSKIEEIFNQLDKIEKSIKA